MTFADTAPHHRLREPTRAECDAADEAAAQEAVAAVGAACFEIIEDLYAALDKRESEWRAADSETVRKLHAFLSEAQALAATLP